MKTLFLISLIIFTANIANAVERINDNCYRWSGVLVCETQKPAPKKEMLKIKPQKKEESPIVKTSWEYAEETGKASYYTVESSSNLTASGERFDEDGMTCASNDYPFNTWLKITNIENGKSIICRVNDRGGFKKYGRIIDLSKGAFAKIADLKLGVINVTVQKIIK
jgi:rare lipoprotein A